jgi:hypothetical protein
MAIQVLRGPRRQRRTLRRGLALALLLAVVGRADSHPVTNASIVLALIAAINTANGNPTVLHAIMLTADDYELVEVHNTSTSANGLPVIGGKVLITGDRASIRRSSDGGRPGFRIFEMALEGKLHLR